MKIGMEICMHSLDCRSVPEERCYIKEKPMTLRLLAAFAIIAGAVGAFAQAAADPPKDVTQVLDRSVSGPERATLALARRMPENLYNFAPSKGAFNGVRTFALLGKHIAVANYQMGAALLGEKLPIEAGPHDNGPDSVRTKAEVVKFLQESFVYLHKAIATVNEHNLMEEVDLPEGGRAARLTVVTAAISHPWDLYGQMIEYLRMNGIDPQKI
jgi:hypothetical protein